MLHVRTRVRAHTHTQICDICDICWKRFYVKYPLFLRDFNLTWVFSIHVRKKLKYRISQKSFQWEPSSSMWKDSRTDMKLIVAFRNFSNVPKGRTDSDTILVCYWTRTREPPLSAVHTWPLLLAIVLYMSRNLPPLSLTCIFSQSLQHCSRSFAYWILSDRVKRRAR